LAIFVIIGSVSVLFIGSRVICIGVWLVVSGLEMLGLTGPLWPL
jgi:hypothetical protein